MARLFHAATGQGQFPPKRRIPWHGARSLLQHGEPVACGDSVAYARTAKHHHGRMHALLTQDAFGLEQFELETQRTQIVLAKQIYVLVRKAVRR